MKKSVNETTDRPGRNVSQKAGLNRAIRHTGWATLKQVLGYKAAVQIDAPAVYTSQTGSACGTIDPHSRRSQSEFQCVAYGHARNADLNAARNIRASGTGAAAWRGALAAATPATREMDTMVPRHFRIVHKSPIFPLLATLRAPQILVRDHMQWPGEKRQPWFWDNNRHRVRRTPNPDANR